MNTRLTPEPTVAAPDGAAPGATPIRVVIVDDTVVLRFLVRRILETDGRFVVVGEAGDGAEAVEVVAQHSPDLVLLDLAMPEMDGLEALPRIRARSPQSTVVVMSGFSEAQMSAQVFGLGAASYLEKGAIAERLIPHIMNLFPDETVGGVDVENAPSAKAAVLDSAAGTGLNGVAHRASSMLERTTDFARRILGDTPPPFALG